MSFPCSCAKKSIYGRDLLKMIDRPKWMKSVLDPAKFVAKFVVALYPINFEP